LDDHYQELLHAPVVPPLKLQLADKKTKKTGQRQRYNKRRKKRRYSSS
jgi:hypothetical protein